MEELIGVILALATLLNSIMIIINFMKQTKKPIDDALNRKLKEALEPINEKLDKVNEDIKKLDKNQCMNYLVNFIEDSKNGIPKDEIQKKRASEVYDHYTKILGGNSYIHDGWEKYVKGDI